MAVSDPAMSAPLDGVRVVEVSSGIAGPYAAMLLAEMGADVTKVEPPEGDPFRANPGFHVLNRSKRGAVLDYRGREDERVRLRAMLLGADVLIHDLTPAVADEAGLSATRLSKEFPNLIACDVTAYGKHGPYAALPSDEGIVGALSCLFGAQHSARPGPTFLVLPLASYATGILSAGYIASALFERRRSGIALPITTSILAGGLAMRSSLAKASTTPPPDKLRDPQGRAPAYRLYEASDGKWFICADARRDAFPRLAIAIDRPDLLTGASGMSPAATAFTPEQVSEIVRECIKVMKTQPRDHWLRLLRAEYDLACAPVLTREEFIQTDLVIENGAAVTVDDPALGRTVQMNFPIDIGGAPGVKNPAPRLELPLTPVVGSVPDSKAPRAIRAHHGPPLAGIRVIDASSFLAGPIAARFLADMGADVIKVEGPAGEGMRDPSGTSAYFAATNRGKRGLCYDHSTPEGRQLFYDLIRSADVLIDGFRPGARSRMGIEYETLGKLNPRLIHCAITGYGRAEAWASFPSFDPVLGALSGAFVAQGGRGHPPVITNSSSAPNDLSAAFLSFFAVTASLFERETTGRGRYISVPQVHAAMAIQAAEMIFYEGKPETETGGPNLLGLSAVNRLYRASDRWMFLAVTQPAQWTGLCKALGRPDLAQRQTPSEVLVAPPDAGLSEELAGIFGSQPAAEWTARLIETGVPCVPVFSTDDPDFDPDTVFDSPALADNHLAMHVPHPVLGVVRHPGNFVCFGGTPTASSLTAPLLGQHNEEILRELGYDSGRIARLETACVLRT